jgi:hypothetical protein
MPRNTSPVDLVIKNASKWMDLHLTKKHLHPFKATWVPTEGSGLVYRGLTAPASLLTLVLVSTLTGSVT